MSDDNDKGELISDDGSNQATEHKPLTNNDVKDLIADLRGGIPNSCSFCHKWTPPEKLHPEEAGDWACEDCLKRWGEW